MVKSILNFFNKIDLTIIIFLLLKMEHINLIGIFIKNQIETYKQENIIEIKIGKKISDEIFKLKLNDPLKIVKEFRNYKLSYSQGKVYKESDLTYKTFNNKNSELIKEELLERNILVGGIFDLLITNMLTKNANVFPSKMDFDDEYEYEEINIHIDKNMILKFENYLDMYLIKIILTLEKDLPYTYQDEIIKNLKIIFDIFEKNKNDLVI